MAKGMKHGSGGGTPLNFKVVAYPTEEELMSANPRGMVVGVVTTEKITSWAFVVTEPMDPEAGMVWFSTDRFSTAQFNALRKNCIQVYPATAKQYIGGEWIDKPVRFFQNGEWVKAWDGVLYDAGNEFETITGGWAFSNGRNNSCTSGTWERGETFLRLHTGADPRACQACTVKKIDLTNYKYLCCNSTGSGSLQIGETEQMYNGVARAVGEGTTRKLDITAYQGEYYVAIHKYTFNNDVTMVWGSFTVTKIWLE